MADSSHDLEIDSDRLYETIEKLASYGAFDDPITGARGVNRLALTDTDAQARRQVCHWFDEAGLETIIDAVGNMYGVRAGSEPGMAPVVSGSHIDTVPRGGAFDGALGILAPLEVVRSLNDRDLATRRPVIVGVFTNEEGTRFNCDMLGSAVAAGRIDLDTALGFKDRDGITVGEELIRTGFAGEINVSAMRPHAYVECHIEQGPILGREGLDIGVVTGVQAIFWHDVKITGRAAHAGTTPVEYRRDPGVAASRINLKLRELTEESRFGGALRATMGGCELSPGAYNVVPSQARASIDVRNPSDDVMDDVEGELITFYKWVEDKENVKIEWERVVRTRPIDFDPGVQEIISSAAGALGLGNREMLSGAGHDAQEWASICKTGMIFIPGEHDGVSHSPREHSTEAQCANGANVLLRTLVELADEA